MAFAQYLAMTAAEMMGNAPPAEGAAWMACHFSPYSTGLCNLPHVLPPESLLILNDRTPIHGHDASRVCRELSQALNGLQCAGLLLDFQNPPCSEALALASYLAGHLDCPMAVTPEYASGNAAVFAPAVPTDTPVSVYLEQWAGKSVWLEAALEGQTIALRPDGATFGRNPGPVGGAVHRDRRLHCHYTMEKAQDCFRFRTWRTREDLAQLLEEAGKLGVRLSVGLYQELREPPPPGA